MSTPNRCAPLSMSQRVEYVDRLRGLAVVGMYFVHTAAAYLQPDLRQADYFCWAMRVSGMVAPIFMFLAGVAVSIVAARSADEARTRRSLAHRGLLVWLGGYALHLAFFALGGFKGDPVKLLKVDVLHCIGAALVLLPAIAWPGKRTWNLSALALFAGLPVLAAATYRWEVLESLPAGLTAYIVPRGKLALFPFVPYAAWVALGLFVGPVWWRFDVRADASSQRRFWGVIVIVALACWLIGVGLKQIYFVSGLAESVEPRQTKGLAYLFWKKSAILLLVFGVARLTVRLDGRGTRDLLVLLGRHSLFAYAAHLMLIYPGLGRRLGYALSPGQHVASALGVGAVTTGLVWAWSRRDFLVRWLREARRRRRFDSAEEPDVSTTENPDVGARPTGPGEV